MKILGIDTSTKVARVSILNDNLTYEKQIDNEITHSEKLMPLIAEVLNDANIKISDIDLFSCTTGPGSFTGIRIALATIKAFSKVFDKPIYAINTLELLAREVPVKNGIIISFIDAKNNRYYYQVFKKEDENVHVLTAAKNKLLEEMLEDINEFILPDTSYVTNSNSIAISNFSDNNTYIKDIDTNILVTIAKNATIQDEHFFDYLTLDATYARSSEAERTKYGE